jgi:hypothetical protein
VLEKIQKLHFLRHEMRPGLGFHQHLTQTPR